MQESITERLSNNVLEIFGFGGEPGGVAEVHSCLRHVSRDGPNIENEGFKVASPRPYWLQ